jgi:hypothetical protein
MCWLAIMIDMHMVETNKHQRSRGGKPHKQLNACKKKPSKNVLVIV